MRARTDLRAPRIPIVTALAGLALVLSACSNGDGSSTTTFGEAPAASGQGTIKVFDDISCAGETGNQPQIDSPFSIGGTGYGANASGTFTIEPQPGSGAVFTAAVTTDANGDFCESPI